MGGSLGNWVDLALLVFFLYYLRDGYRRGFFVLALEVIGFTAAIVGALLLYPTAGGAFVKWFGLPLPYAKASGFFAVWVIIEVAYPPVAGFLYDRIPPKTRVAKGVKVAGIGPAALQATFLAALLLSLVVSLPFAPWVKSDIFRSKVASEIVRGADRLERLLDASLGGAVKETLAFLTVQQGSTDTVDLRFTTEDFRPDPDAERRMIDLVNAERAARGIAPLTPDETLVPVARLHSADMLRRGYFSHASPEGKLPSDRADDAGISYRVFGENIAFAPDPSIAHAGLMNSEGHRANILSPEFTRIGIGVEDAGPYGMMFTQNFAD